MTTTRRYGRRRTPIEKASGLFRRVAPELAGTLATVLACGFLTKIVYRFFWWVYAVEITRLFPWLVSVLLLGGAVFLAVRLSRRWQLVSGSVLVLGSLWLLRLYLPRIGPRPSWIDRDWVFAHVHAVQATAVVMLVLGAFSLATLVWVRVRPR